jgi:hypothetical protein
MVYSLNSSLVLLLLVAECGFSQIGIGFPGQQYPGQYPGGGGGIGFPMPGGGRRSRTNQDSQLPTQNFSGTLRRISSIELVLATDDKRVVTISLGNSTRYYKSLSDEDYSGNGRQPSSTAKRADFQPGDQVSIDATQDDNNYYHATRVAMVKHGTDDDRAKASEPVDSSPVSTSGNSGNNNDDDRPQLHRASRPDSGDSSNTQTPSSSGSAPPPLPADNSGQPTLQRAGQSRSSASSSDSGSGPVIADSRPSIHAEEVNGVTRLPDAPQVGNASGGHANGDLDSVIANAREEAFSFTETLPNYVVKQFTTRFVTQAAHGGKTSWQALDNVTADVVSENGKESYKNIMVNGRAPKEAPEKTGAWSSGEFSSMQLDILSPVTDADFRNKRSTTIVNRSAFRYDFTVQQPNSHWHVYSDGQSYSPGYTGAIWVDKESSRVLRIELSAQNVPRAFPLDTVESAIDYDFVLIGDNKYLLPVHSEALSCERGTSDCTRNVIDFRNYKKFTADANITFDPAK